MTNDPKHINTTHVCRYTKEFRKETKQIGASYSKKA